MFEIIFAQIFSCCQTWPFHIKDDSPKKSNIFGCFLDVWDVLSLYPDTFSRKICSLSTKPLKRNAKTWKQKENVWLKHLLLQNILKICIFFFVKNYLCQLLWFPSQWNLWKAVGLKRLSTGYPGRGLIRYFFPTLSDIDMYNGSKIKGEYIMWIFRVSVFINSRDFHYLNSE